jgi:hypothetical protein
LLIATVFVTKKLLDFNLKVIKNGFNIISKLLIKLVVVAWVVV